MVNGFGRENIKRKSSYICKRSQQVSILIITMSVLFLIGISTAVILLESEWTVFSRPYAMFNDPISFIFFAFFYSEKPWNASIMFHFGINPLNL